MGYILDMVGKILNKILCLESHTKETVGGEFVNMSMYT